MKFQLSLLFLILLYSVSAGAVEFSCPAPFHVTNLGKDKNCCTLTPKCPETYVLTTEGCGSATGNSLQYCCKPTVVPTPTPKPTPTPTPTPSFSCTAPNFLVDAGSCSTLHGAMNPNNMEQCCAKCPMGTSLVTTSYTNLAPCSGSTTFNVYSNTSTVTPIGCCKATKVGVQVDSPL